MRKLLIKSWSLLYFPFFALKGFSQDPHFSQFFRAPQFINPALVGTQIGEWNIMGNFRQQWSNAGTPFTTQNISSEVKFTGKHEEDDENTIALGLSLQNDKSMYGAFSSNYFSTCISYHLILNENNKLALGIENSFGNRRIDYSQLTFGEQFTSTGFDATLPTGEQALSNMKPFHSFALGLLYTYSTNNFNLDIGAGAFDLNKPKQSFLEDPQQELPIRSVAHFNAEYFSPSRFFISYNTLFHYQSNQGYWTIGGSLGLDLTAGYWDKIMYLGSWYRQGDAFYPYLGLRINNLQIGLSYDITTSKQIIGPSHPRSFEFSFMISRSEKNDGYLSCRVPRKFQNN